MLSLEVCKALKEMGHPQDKSTVYWGSLNDSPFELFYPGNRHFQLYGPYMEKYACPSEIEALDWLETLRGYQWVRSQSAPQWNAWHTMSIGIYDQHYSGKNPSELILAIYKDCKKGQA